MGIIFESLISNSGSEYIYMESQKKGHYRGSKNIRDIVLRKYFEISIF